MPPEIDIAARALIEQLAVLAPPWRARDPQVAPRRYLAAVESRRTLHAKDNLVGHVGRLTAAGRGRLLCRVCDNLLADHPVSGGHPVRLRSPEAPGHQPVRLEAPLDPREGSGQHITSEQEESL